MSAEGLAVEADRLLAAITTGLDNPSGGHLAISHRPEKAAKGQDPWLVGIEWGTDDPENPGSQFYGNAAYQTGRSLPEALEACLREAGWL